MTRSADQTDREPATRRLDALELRSMDAELAQATLDAVVLEHAERIDRLERRLTALIARLDAAGNEPSEPAHGSLAEALEQERPPHY